MTENERIRELRKHLKLTLSQFGEKIGTAPNTLSNIENGNRSVTNQMRALIVSNYDVNEQWLKTGDGEMFIVKSESDKLAELFADLMCKPVDDEERQLAEGYAALTKEERKQLVGIMRKLARGIK